MSRLKLTKSVVVEHSTVTPRTHETLKTYVDQNVLCSPMLNKNFDRNMFWMSRLWHGGPKAIQRRISTEILIVVASLHIKENSFRCFVCLRCTTIVSGVRNNLWEWFLVSFCCMPSRRWAKQYSNFTCDGTENECNFSKFFSDIRRFSC